MGGRGLHIASKVRNMKPTVFNLSSHNRTQTTFKCVSPSDYGREESLFIQLTPWDHHTLGCAVTGHFFFSLFSSFFKPELRTEIRHAALQTDAR